MSVDFKMTRFKEFAEKNKFRRFVIIITAMNFLRYLTTLGCYGCMRLSLENVTNRSAGHIQMFLFLSNSIHMVKILGILTCSQR
jgi:hypothetical protein